MANKNRGWSHLKREEKGKQWWFIKDGGGQLGSGQICERRNTATATDGERRNDARVCIGIGETGSGGRRTTDTGGLLRAAEGARAAKQRVDRWRLGQVDMAGKYFWSAGAAWCLAAGGRIYVESSIFCNCVMSIIRNINGIEKAHRDSRVIASEKPLAQRTRCNRNHTFAIAMWRCQCCILACTSGRYVRCTGDSRINRNPTAFRVGELPGWGRIARERGL